MTVIRVYTLQSLRSLDEYVCNSAKEYLNFEHLCIIYP